MYETMRDIYCPWYCHDGKNLCVYSDPDLVVDPESLEKQNDFLFESFVYRILIQFFHVNAINFPNIYKSF